MAREFRVLRALEGSAVPHPRAIGYCDDATVIGSPFLVLELVDGFTPVDPLPPSFEADVDARHQLGPVLVDGLAELALVDWRAAGLDGFGKPDGFLERQVGRWLGQLDHYRTRPLDELDGLVRWLDTNRPAMGAPGIVHGDFSLYNVLITHERPVRLAAIIDWDTATIGDPMMDLGLLLARWHHDGEDAVGVVDIGDRRGLASRGELAVRYADRTSRDVSAIDFYEVLALFKLACIIEGNYARAAQRADGSADAIAGIVPSLLHSAAAIASGRR
jgi:aminoglycoside phosphotransferase (APT) family kinase protein